MRRDIKRLGLGYTLDTYKVWTLGSGVFILKKVIQGIVSGLLYFYDLLYSCTNSLYLAFAFLEHLLSKLFGAVYLKFLFISLTLS